LGVAELDTVTEIRMGEALASKTAILTAYWILEISAAQV